MDPQFQAATMSQDLMLDLTDLGSLDAMDSNMNPFSPPDSPFSLTSSLLALSPITESDLDPPPSSDLDTNPPTSSPSPLAIKVRPLSSMCDSCGSSVISPSPSTVALYSLAITMGPPATRTSLPRQSKRTPPTTASSNPTTASAPAPARGRKRKAAPTETETDVNSGPTDSAPAPAPPAKAKAKTQSNTKGKGKVTTTASESVIPATPVPDVDSDLLDNSMPSQSEEALPDPIQEAEEFSQPAPAPPNVPGPSSAHQVSEGTNDSRTMEALEKENRALKKFKVMWIKQQQEKNAVPGEGSSASDPADGSVPRPPGERGKNGWNMQTALQLEHDGDKYNAILATTRDAVRQAGLDWQIKFDEQDPARVGVCYSQMKRIHPHLKRFKNDWACRELVIGTLQNRRKSEHSKIKNLLNDKQAERAPAKRAGFKPRPKPKEKGKEKADDSGSGAASADNAPNQEQN